MPLVRRLVTLDEEVSSFVEYLFSVICFLYSFASFFFFNVKNGGKIAGTVNDFKQKCRGIFIIKNRDS